MRGQINYNNTKKSMTKKKGARARTCRAITLVLILLSRAPSCRKLVRLQRINGLPGGASAAKDA